MSTVFVQFSDSTQKTIIAAFSCAQDPDVYTNQGTVDSSDARYIAFVQAAGA